MPSEKHLFISSLDPRNHLDQLFNLSPDLYFFAKDRHSRFMMCNEALLQKLGMSSEDEIIGKDDYYYFEKAIADKYREEDREVMESRCAVSNRVWLVPNASGIMEWYLSNKIPLFNHEGEVVGIAGLMSDHQRAGAVLGSYQNMATVIDYISAHYGEQIEVSELAAMTHLSVSQFERRFKKIFRMTPIRYVNQVRIDNAVQELVRTNRTVADIAVACGYYDHSYFTKQFKKSVGVTPLQYRKTYYSQAMN